MGPALAVQPLAGWTYHITSPILAVCCSKFLDGPLHRFTVAPQSEWDIETSTEAENGDIRDGHNTRGVIIQ